MTRFATLAAAGALTFTLAVVASVPAWAEDAPIRGSAECTVAVNAAPAVTAAMTLLDNAKGLLDLLPADAPLADREQATDAVNQADEALVAARAAAELELCVDLPVDPTDPESTPRTEPTTTPPATTTTVPPAVTVETVAAEIAALNCDGYGAKTGRIVDDTSALFGRATAEQLGALSDAYNAKLKALNYCIGSSTPATSTTTVNPTQDDGSVANTSGTQVREVPAGSVQTGAV